MIRNTLAAAVTLLLLAGPVHAQIVDTLAGFAHDDRGWSGGLGAAVATSGGNTERFDLSSAGRVQWASDDDRWRGLGAYGRATSRDETISESAFAHLRQNHRLTDRWWTLAFVQFAHEPFQKLSSRVLVGAGARLSLRVEEGRRIAVGAAPMLEWETLEGAGASDLDTRLSTFLDLETPLGEAVTLAATGFAQPRWEDLGDLRAVVNARLTVELADQLDLVIGGSYAHDANPPEDVRSDDWSLRTGLELSL